MAHGPGVILVALLGRHRFFFNNISSPNRSPVTAGGGTRVPGVHDFKT